MMPIALNGFGRIGRMFVSRLFQHPVQGMRIVAINDLMNTESAAYLFKHDSVHGGYPGTVEHTQNTLVIDGVSVPFSHIPSPEDCPWSDLGIDIVVEATGRFTTYDDASFHQKAGAKHVIVTAPVKGSADGMPGETVLVGVNDEKIKGCTLSSNGSCTTNAIALPLKVLDDSFGVESAVLTTIHAYTGSQPLVDSHHKEKMRLGRAGAINIIPSSTGAAVATVKALPQLEGRFDGLAVRVPVVCGSLADITVVVKKPTSVDEVNRTLSNAAMTTGFQDLLAVTHEPLVSGDIIGQPYAAIVDMEFTRVVNRTLVKLFSWYDNEAGYVTTLIHHIQKVVL